MKTLFLLAILSLSIAAQQPSPSQSRGARTPDEYVKEGNPNP